MNDITLNDIDKVHTIKTLAKFWTDADKAGKIEFRPSSLQPWTEVTSGPDLGSKICNYQIKRVPAVFYRVKYGDTDVISNVTFTTFGAAVEYIRIQTASATVIKFVEELL